MNTKGYALVFGALAALTILTVGAAELHLGTTVAILIAAIKASLVGVFFMHLKYEGRFTRFIALFPLGLFIFLLLMILPDYLP